jgi:uncharacterized protein (UPF0335 family)/predicted component of type VI protein secretion system
MDLESSAKELKMLASRQTLTPSELNRAKDLMAQLKESGMSNAEIAELTGGRWSESTLKGYNKGVKANAAQSWKSTTALFSEMLSKDLALDDVSKAISVTTELEGMRSSLTDVVSFMEDIRKVGTNITQLKEAADMKTRLEEMSTSPEGVAGFVKELGEHDVDVPTFVSLFSEWHEAGLMPADARLALTHRAQLEQAGLDIETTSKVVKAAGKFGGYKQVIESLTKYGSLVELNREAQKKRKSLDAQAVQMESHNRELDNAGRKLEKLRKEIATAEATLATYERLKSAGFDEKLLREVATAAQKFGTLRQVLEAINQFGSLSAIKAAEAEWTNQISRKQEMLKSLEAQYAHLKESIELCKSLLEHKFSLTTISLIEAMARKYGEPIEVMKAIEEYGQLIELRRKIVQAKAELAGVEGKVEVLNETYSRQSARNKAMLDQIEILHGKAVEVGRAVGTIEEQLKGDSMACDLLGLLQNPTSAPYEDSLPLILVLLKCFAVWVIMHKSKFRYPSLVSSNLTELLKNLGAG